MHLVAATLLTSLPLLMPPARAGSITASSIWDRSNALERARQQLPAGAVVTREQCQEVEVGIGNIRYLCTVDFTPATAPTTPVPGPTPSAPQ
jgi:hypothetical protein